MATGLPTDEDLLLDIQQSSSSSFAVLVRRHNKKYYHLAYRYMANIEEAEDIVQNAFLKLWENPAIWKVSKKTKFTTWFYRIVVNLCLDKKKKHRTLQLPEMFEISDDSNNQERESSKRQIQKLITQEVIALPDRQKTALILCYYEDVANKEAAEIMNISVRALQSLVMRAKTAIKHNMKNYL